MTLTLQQAREILGPAAHGVPDRELAYLLGRLGLLAEVACALSRSEAPTQEEQGSAAC